MTNLPVSLDNTPVEVLMWAHPDQIEDSALQQLRDVAQLPGLYGLRVMPDVHWGNGATVGSVIAMEQALAPAAVGVDIGCGVNAVKTTLNIENLDARDLKALRTKFENTIPLGMTGYKTGGEQLTFLGMYGAKSANFLNSVRDLRADLTQVRKDGSVVRTNDKARESVWHQLGTLGGGNHFIELCTDSSGDIWITLHSGSRNIGKTLAEKHIEIAKKDPRNADMPDHLRDLSLFYKGTPEMDNYLHDLSWAQEFAMRSRTVMMELVKKDLRDYFETHKPSLSVGFDQEINCHHNYVSTEEIDGTEMIVTRKGAISARDGELALIPGSMKTGSYIVKGLGNPRSFQSASHGAGRKMSRRQALKAYTTEDLKEVMKGVEVRTDQAVVDEIPFAYKDLDSVIAAESDLVEVVEKLDTVLCVKGD